MDTDHVVDEKFESIIWDQHECRHEYGARSPDDDDSIRKQYEQFRTAFVV
jgi:hypothetical protein